MAAEFHGRVYLLPEATVIERQDGSALVASVPVGFWTALYPATAPATGWQTLGQGRRLLVTVPDATYPWMPSAVAGQPPVPGPVIADTMRDGVQVWRRAGSGDTVAELYLTYGGRDDLYVRCDARQIWNFDQACDLVGTDSGVLTVFPIYGNRVAVAPAVLDAFRRAVRG